MSSSFAASRSQWSRAALSRGSSCREKLLDCVLITTCGVLLAMALRPFQNTPFIDDWLYAWSVAELLDHGRLRVLDWSSHVNVAQILWGAAFSLPLGFSFTALRVSTWVLGLLCLCGLYLLLRELGIPRRDALIGTGTLGVNPIFAILSYSFMTDIPFLAALVWSLFAAARAIHR